MTTRSQAVFERKGARFTLRLPHRVDAELARRADALSTTNAELARRLLTAALSNREGERELVEALCERTDLRLEAIAKSLAEDAESRASEMKDLRRALERALIQQTEILMILRTVTYKDRPEDYEIAMTKTRELLPTVVGASSGRPNSRAVKKEAT